MLAGLMLAMMAIGCKNDTPEGNTDGVNTQEVQKAVIDPATIKFLCEASDEPNDMADAPRHEVFLQIGNSKVKVADILNCETLGKDSYEQNQIPKEAIAAVGGWWAGAGDYLYIIEEDGKYVVKKGSSAEEDTSNDFGYKTIMQFSKTGEEVY